MLFTLRPAGPEGDFAKATKYPAAAVPDIAKAAALC